MFACIPLVALVPRAERWTDSLAAFRAAVVAERGLVPVDAVVPPDRREVVWNWTSPTLSLLVRNDPGDAILVDSAPVFTPFAPEDAHKQLDARYTWGGR